jgi:hypothetical protein
MQTWIGAFESIAITAAFGAIGGLYRAYRDHFGPEDGVVSKYTHDYRMHGLSFWERNCGLWVIIKGRWMYRRQCEYWRRYLDERCAADRSVNSGGITESSWGEMLRANQDVRDRFKAYRLRVVGPVYPGDTDDIREEEVRLSQWSLCPPPRQ